VKTTAPKISQAVARNALSALRAFVDYYDQAGMPDRLTSRVEDDPPDGFDGDEVFNVRWGRKVLRRAESEAARECAT